MLQKTQTSSCFLYFCIILSLFAMEEQRRGTNSRFEEFDVCWKVFWKVPRELFFWLALGKMWLSNISDIVRASTIFKLLGMMLHSLCLSLDITFRFSPHSHFYFLTLTLWHFHFSNLTLLRILWFFPILLLSKLFWTFWGGWMMIDDALCLPLEWY